MDYADISVGLRIPPLHIAVTAKIIVMGASASRDWQPQHHDSAWTRTNLRLPDIIMNNYTQCGFISRYITDWSGPQGRLGRLKCSMRRPICPGHGLTLAGVIQSIEQSSAGFSWIGIGVEIAADEDPVTRAHIRLALPLSSDGPSPWHCPSAQWKP
jgi:acyl dehydratase